MKKKTAILVACALAAGCAMPDDNAQADAYKAPVYRTGSNIPAGRDTGQPPSEMSAGERRALEDLQNRPRQPTGLTK